MTSPAHHATNPDHCSAASTPVNEWDRFLQNSRPDIGYKQYSWWKEFQENRGWDSFAVAARDDADEICGGAIVLLKSFAPGKRFYYIPHGPVLPTRGAEAAELFDDILAYIDERRREDSCVVSHLRLEPRWLRRPKFVDPFEDSTSWHEPRDTLCVDLSVPEDAILSQMKKKGRYNVRVARRHQVSVVEDNSFRGLTDFLRLYNETSDRQGIRRHSTQHFHTLAELLFPYNRGSLFFAEYQGQRLATAMIVYAGDTATYKYGGSLRSHRNVMAPYLLHFEAMLHAKALGCNWYDFYGVSPNDDSKQGWENFSVFKRKFGGSEFNFVPSLDRIYDSAAYQEFRDRKRA